MAKSSWSKLTPAVVRLTHPLPDGCMQLRQQFTEVHWSNFFFFKKLLPVGPTPRLSVPRLSRMFRLLVLPSELPSKSLVSMIKFLVFHQRLIRVTDVLVFSELFILDSSWFQIFPVPVILLIPRARRPGLSICCALSQVPHVPRSAPHSPVPSPGETLPLSDLSGFPGAPKQSAKIGPHFYIGNEST